MYEALIDQIREALGQRGRPMDVGSIPSLVAQLHPSDLAAILDELTLPEAERVFALLDDERAAEALAQAAPATRRHLVQTSPPTHVAAQLGRMEMDDVADVMADVGRRGHAGCSRCCQGAALARSSSCSSTRKRRPGAS